MSILDQEQDINFLIQCCVRVGGFFATDPEKAEFWMNSPRDDFGMSPAEACLTGNGKKMLKCIEALLTGNRP